MVLVLTAVAVVVSLVLVVAMVVVLRRRSGPSSAHLERQLAACLAAVGPARCSAATELLEGMARRGDKALIAAMWDRLELPLLEAAPDCPPQHKSRLIAALEDCHACIEQRVLQRRLIDMRNGLASDTDAGMMGADS
ncbi:MAG: hypothetical protein PF961_06185 [Planctomycetota bacterium]|jgi:hypothetical protein|nr:hypothetical protein [Planctomycetota bacterium]